MFFLVWPSGIRPLEGGYCYVLYSAPLVLGLRLLSLICLLLMFKVLCSPVISPRLLSLPVVLSVCTSLPLVSLSPSCCLSPFQSPSLLSQVLVIFLIVCLFKSTGFTWFLLVHFDTSQVFGALQVSRCSPPTFLDLSFPAHFPDYLPVSTLSVPSHLFSICHLW